MKAVPRTHSGGNPMSAALISDRLSEITGLEHSEKTVLRKLQRLVSLQDRIDDSVLEKHLQLSLGGTMVEISNRVYPLMAILGEKDLCEAVVECKANAIGVVIDYFGMDLRILPPVLDHPANETDINGGLQKYVSIKLPRAQYENVRGFCLQQHFIVTVVSPDRLILDVKKGLMAAAAKLPEIL